MRSHSRISCAKDELKENKEDLSRIRKERDRVWDGVVLNGSEAVMLTGNMEDGKVVLGGGERLVNNVENGWKEDSVGTVD